MPLKELKLHITMSMTMDIEDLFGSIKKISDIQLTKSKLMLIKNLIGNLERLGIVHILVNDETIKSWVDPYEE